VGTYRVYITPRRPEGIVPMIPAAATRKNLQESFPPSIKTSKAAILTAVVKATAARSTSSALP